MLGDTAARLTQAQEQLEALQTQQRDENRNNTALIAKKDVYKRQGLCRIPELAKDKIEEVTGVKIFHVD